MFYRFLLGLIGFFEFFFKFDGVSYGLIGGCCQLSSLRSKQRRILSLFPFQTLYSCIFFTGQAGNQVWETKSCIFSCISCITGFSISLNFIQGYRTGPVNTGNRTLLQGFIQYRMPSPGYRTHGNVGIYKSFCWLLDVLICPCFSLRFYIFMLF